MDKIVYSYTVRWIYIGPGLSQTIFNSSRLTFINWPIYVYYAKALAEILLLIWLLSDHLCIVYYTLKLRPLVGAARVGCCSITGCGWCPCWIVSCSCWIVSCSICRIGRWWWRIRWWWWLHCGGCIWMLILADRRHVLHDCHTVNIIPAPSIILNLLKYLFKGYLNLNDFS